MFTRAAFGLTMAALLAVGLPVVVAMITVAVVDIIAARRRAMAKPAGPPWAD